MNRNNALHCGVLHCTSIQYSLLCSTEDSTVYLFGPQVTFLHSHQMQRLYVQCSTLEVEVHGTALCSARVHCTDKSSYINLALWYSHGDWNSREILCWNFLFKMHSWCSKMRLTKKGLFGNFCCPWGTLQYFSLQNLLVQSIIKMWH